MADVLLGSDGDILLGSDGDILLGAGSGPVTSVVGILAVPGASASIFTLTNNDGGLFSIELDGVTVDGPTVNGTYSISVKAVTNIGQATRTFQLQYTAPTSPWEGSDGTPWLSSDGTPWLSQ